jgi:hypothetical protein
LSVLPNARHEQFAQQLAQGKDADEAYALAGYKPNRGNAATLKAKQSISARVTQLQAKAAKKVAVSVEGLADELEQAQVMAIADRQAGAAVQATMGKAKLFGFGKETRRIEGGIQVTTFNPEDLAKLTDDELDTLEEAIRTMQRFGFLPPDNTDDPSGENDAA